MKPVNIRFAMPADLHRALKSKAAAEGVPLKEALLNAAAAWVANDEAKDRQRTPAAANVN